MKELENLGKEIKDVIPKIKLDTDDITDPVVNVFKKWILVVLSSLIIAGAVILIIKSLIGKFF